MQLTRANFGDFIYFLAVARHSSFSRAGVEVGISASALSHAIKGLEARLGVRLLNRTTRSVTLTAAGEELLALISEPVDKIDQAIELLNKFRDEPTGRIRLNVFSDAALLLLAPVLSTFAHRYPDIEVEVSTTNSMVDIVEGGFDAGIRYGATVPEGMIAQSLSPCSMGRGRNPRLPRPMWHAAAPRGFETAQLFKVSARQRPDVQLGV